MCCFSSQNQERKYSKKQNLRKNQLCASQIPPLKFQSCFINFNQIFDQTSAFFTIQWLWFVGALSFLRTSRGVLAERFVSFYLIFGLYLKQDVKIIAARGNKRLDQLAARNKEQREKRDFYSSSLFESDKSGCEEIFSKRAKFLDHSRLSRCRYLADLCGLLISIIST